MRSEESWKKITNISSESENIIINCLCICGFKNNLLPVL